MAKELLSKLRNFVKDDMQDLLVGKGSLRKTKNNNFAEAKRAFDSGGAIVIADTKSQMGKVNDFLEDNLNGRMFVAIVDEGKAISKLISLYQKGRLRCLICLRLAADSMYRTYNQSQVSESGLRALNQPLRPLTFTLSHSNTQPGI